MLLSSYLFGIKGGCGEEYPKMYQRIVSLLKREYVKIPSEVLMFRALSVARSVLLESSSVSN